MARHLRDQHGQGTQNKQLNYDLKNQNDSEVLTSKHPTTTTATINCPNCNINIDQNFLPKHVRYCTLQDMRSTSELTEKSTKLNENIDESGKFKFESQPPPAIELSMPEVGEEINIQICTQLLDKSTVSKIIHFSETLQVYYSLMKLQKNERENWVFILKNTKLW